MGKAVMADSRSQTEKGKKKDGKEGTNQRYEGNTEKYICNNNYGQEECTVQMKVKGEILV